MEMNGDGMKVICLYLDKMMAYEAFSDKALGGAVRALLAYARGEEVPALSGNAYACFAMLCVDFLRECKRHATFVESRSERGKKGAKARWGKEKTLEELAEPCEQEEAALSRPGMGDAADKGEEAGVDLPSGDASAEAAGEQDGRARDGDDPLKNRAGSQGGGRDGRFVPPTVEEVTAYCKERHNSVKAERFVDYYTVRGWMAGKTQMRDWRAAVRAWEDQPFAGTANDHQPNAHQAKKTLVHQSYAQRSYLGEEEAASLARLMQGDLVV